MIQLSEKFYNLRKKLVNIGWKTTIYVEIYLYSWKKHIMKKIKNLTLKGSKYNFKCLKNKIDKVNNILGK